MQKSNKYPKMFEPGYIGRMRVKNRVVMPPMHVAITGSDGSPDERYIKYYEERAKGGVGLIITEAASVVDDTSSTGPRSIYISKHSQIPDYERLTEEHFARYSGVRGIVQQWIFANEVAPK